VPAGSRRRQQASQNHSATFTAATLPLRAKPLPNRHGTVATKAKAKAKAS